ncbi:hypothetical protein [Chryseobacterium indoltheticum]|uniref:hypothetical protein n=1 Tax=Chryseobacterium indoltheticum TaxID=254 RepID=UPI003F49A1B1
MPEQQFISNWGLLWQKQKELIEVYGAEIINKLIFQNCCRRGNYFFEIAKIRGF